MNYDSIIIGKGPAGISAAIYLKRAGREVIIIGKDGGALEKTEAIDNYYGFEQTISGQQLLKQGWKQAQRLHIPIQTDEVTNVMFDGTEYKVETRNRTYQAKTLILATGTNRKEPSIPGVRRLEGKGVSYCAICDAFFYRNKTVAVLGNGDYAIKEAKILLPIVRSVTILTNGKELVENRDESMETIHVEKRSIKEMEGTEILENIIFEDHAKMQLDGIFIAVGTASSTDFARKLGALIQNNNIVVNEAMQTNIPGLFACGDCTGGLLQIAKAVYEGAKAGLSCIEFLKKKAT